MQPSTTNTMERSIKTKYRTHQKINNQLSNTLRFLNHVLLNM